MTKTELLERIHEMETQLKETHESVKHPRNAVQEAVRALLPVHEDTLELVKSLAEKLPDES